MRGISSILGSELIRVARYFSSARLDERADDL
jgi:hypothetical protein